MSLARTALRMAAVQALAADPVIAALVTADRIYDSRIDALDAQEPVPVIVVLTEDDKGLPWSRNNGGPPFDHHCDLMFEISLRVVTPDPNGEMALGLPETDAEAEATLDLLEGLAVDAVTNADTPQASLIRREVMRRAVELKSIRFASSESGAKLALRMVTLSTELKIDQPNLLDPPTGPFASLPQPLRAVAASLPSGSSAAAICQLIAGKLAPTPAPSLATGVDVTLAVGPLSRSTPPVPQSATATGVADPILATFNPSGAQPSTEQPT